MSNTPRTDNEFYKIGRNEWVVDADFARELELENAALRAALERRHAEQSYPMPDYVRDALKAKGAKQ